MYESIEGGKNCLLCSLTSVFFFFFVGILHNKRQIFCLQLVFDHVNWILIFLPPFTYCQSNL